MSLAKTLNSSSWRWLGRSRTGVILGLGFSLVVGYLAFKDIDWGGLSAQLSDFKIRYALASLLLFTLATAFRAYRWQVLFLNEKVPLHRLFLVQHAGIGINSISPIRVISEATQFFLLTLRYHMQKDTVVATLGLQRIQDFVAGSVLLGFGLMLVPGIKGFAPYIVASGVMALLSILAIPAFIWFASRPGHSHSELVTSTCTSLRCLVQARVELVWSSAVTLLYWLALGLSVWVLAYGMGIDISFLVATLLVIGTLTFVSLVPSLPASVGTFEFAVYYLLTTLGVGPTEALGFALILHTILFLPPILIAFAVFASWTIQSRRRRASEGDAGKPATGPAYPADAPGLDEMAGAMSVWRPISAIRGDWRFGPNRRH